MSTYISRTDTAKLIRKALKENFSGIKFSVKCRAGGSSIEVEWTDGPTTLAVNKVVKVFEGASFDGMYDLKTHKNSTLNGEDVQFGADYVMSHRKTTRAFVVAIITAYCERHNCDASKIKVRGSDVDAQPDAWDLGVSEDHWIQELLENTEGWNMYRPYEAQEERQQAEHNEYIRTRPQRNAEEKARKEKEAAERVKADAARRQREQEQAKARQEQEERRQREQAARRSKVYIYTRDQALAYLGLTNNATPEQVKIAFRNRVKAAADGRGGYTGDMDLLVTAKEKALAG